MSDKASGSEAATEEHLKNPVDDEMSRIEWIEAAVLENLKFRLQNADALAKDGLLTLTIMMTGIGAGMAYIVKTLEGKGINAIGAGVLLMVVWLLVAAVLLVLNCIMSRNLQVPGNDVLELWQPDRPFKSLRKAELNSMQTRIDLSIARNQGVAIWLDRTRLMAVASPLLFLLGWKMFGL